MFTFIESSAFEAIRSVYLDDDEFAELQQFMMQNPESGQLVPRSGGCVNCDGSVREWESAEVFG